MSGHKRPAGMDFDPPALPTKQLRVEPPLSQQSTAQTPPTGPAPSPGTQQFVLPGRHPLDTSRRLSQGARLIGIPGILPNVSRQPPPPLQPSTFGFPSPASTLSPFGLPLHPPIPAGGLVGISPNPVTGIPHIRSPHIPIPPFPPMGHIPHSQAPPTGMVALETSYIPSEHHAVTTAPLALIRPASVPSLGFPPRPLIAGSPLTPPPPYPIAPFPHSVGGATGEEFMCASPSQFLRSPTSIATSSLPSSIESPLPSTQTTASSDKTCDTTTSTALQKETRLAVAPPLYHGHTRVGSKRDHHSVKTRLLKHQRSWLAGLKLHYEIQLKERFFLEGGGNMMDFLQWKKKPNILREQFLKQHDIDGETTTVLGQLSHNIPLSLSSDVKTSQARLDSEHPLPPENSGTETSGTHRRSSKTIGAGGSSGRSHSRHDSSSSSTRIQIPLSTVSPSLQVVSPLPSAPLASTPKPPSLPPSTPSSPLKSSLHLSSSSPRPSTRAQLQTQVSFSSVYETSHEDIVMRARHEAEVMRAIADLRKEGLWSTSRLPKVQEPGRRRALWDFLLEEMQWLATDFANERRWKINAAKKLSRSMLRHHQEQSTLSQRSEKEELQRIKKIASTIAKEVKHFWESVRKIVELKHQSLLEEKRKAAMDMHLQFIVDQTQKYSNWLVQGMGGNTPSTTPSLAPSLTSSSILSETGSESMFTPVHESDDEATIDKEESDMEKEGGVDYSSEIRQLEAEGEMPIMDLIASLPSEIMSIPPTTTSSLQGAVEEEGEGEGEKEGREGEEGEASPERSEDPSPPVKRVTRSRAVAGAKEESKTVADTASVAGEEEEKREEGEGVKGEGVKGEGEDKDYEMEKEEEEEDEMTIQEQERHEEGEGEGGEEVDHQAEIYELNKENELSLEELLALYDLERRSATPDTTLEGSSKPDTSIAGSDVGESEDEDDEEEDEEEEEEEKEREEGGETGETTEDGFSGVAAAAEQFQPKGITLDTTDVKTTVPFLLRGTLREYQHIGLDWLVAMDERRLNGILADEMGLGKTIQTIALLAHLACEKGNWGPHLIIVPTSVMLNWELELKKWCPAFKILTYFGSFKERKQKRVGWSKYNAFHVCITSYNIAVQDHRAFKQKRWKYLVLDEAQNIKNFKSQRWQTLLNFNSQRRLLLTGTPLQNNLMELWSLMHFLMPTVFSSHTDFKEWFSNPLTGMVEGSQEYNESIVTRLHQVLRPFLLRRLKMEVERQMPKKYEHILSCRLSKRQRFLYEEYMSRTKTKETLAAGNYLSVINILMQLRKVCNHPDLFEPRPTLSPFRMTAIRYYTASLVLHAMQYDPFKHVCLGHLNLRLPDTEFTVEAFAAFRCSQLQAPRAYLLDPLSAHPHGVDLTGERGGLLAGGDEGELSDLFLPGLTSAQEEWGMGRHRHMHDINSLRCQRQPVYGRDLVHTILSLCRQQDRRPSQPSSSSPATANEGVWLWTGSLACERVMTGVRPEDGGSGSLALSKALLSYHTRAHVMEDTIRRFTIALPPATVPQISLHCHHPPPSHTLRETEVADAISRHLSPASSLLHTAATAASLQFPETRLIQYDCGKLQMLDSLLQQLKMGAHRVLIFTQMARMLDVLEIFLNYHGHTYLRLDGSTPPLKRQFLMDRFNRDKKIFCFILSTRSGGLGVNLTGADTVVFYDSDWNPTMDAQAQDRCHRIGQTRDVHIYRLVSERTVEENILKKANQKKLLGNIAIEGGAFTTDFFRKASLRELFKVQREEGRGRVAMETTTEEELSQKQIEEMLADVEDDTDVQAARMARAEETAEMAEFDENFNSQSTATAGAAPSKEGKTALTAGVESQVQSEFDRLQEELSGVEQYAMRYLEAERAHVTSQELRQAEENIRRAKKDWELTHLQSLRAAEERLAEEEAEDVLLTYDRPETANKMIVDRETGDEMPMWLPPTPPAEEEDEIYMDPILSLTYHLSSTISPAVLAAHVPFHVDDYDVFGLWRPPPPVVEPVKKSHQKSSSKKIKENVNVPPSLFWRHMAADSLPTKLRKLTSHHSKKTKNKESFTPILEQHPEGPDWIPYEDWILLKCITTVLEFPLSLTISVPAQIPNWSIVSDLTSAISKVKRSPLQCREHLMNTVIPREGPVVKGEESGDLKRHRSKDGSLKKSKGRREQRTKGLVMADGGRDLTDQYSTSFNWLLSAASKRNQQSKFAWESLQKHSMHSELLKEYGIVVDIVHSPANVAQLRAERLQSVAAARAYQTAASGYTKASTPGLATPTDLTKLGGAFGLPGNRVVSGVLPPRVTLPLPTSLSSSSAMANPVPLSTVVSSLPTTTLPVSNPSLPSSTHITHPLTSSLPIPATSAVKAAYAPDLVGKIVPLQRHLSQQHAQFLLLRQNALQQQQAGGGANSQLTTAGLGGIPRLQTPPQSVLGTQKAGLPAGIEQLRPSVPSLPLQQRFTAAVTSAANAMRNITSRSLQTEEVLALLKQQSLRMAACQTYRAAHPTIQQQRESAVSAQLQAQLTRPELTKSAIVLTSESASSFSSHAEQGKLLVQPTARVVQVPITTAVSIPATPSSSVPAPSSSSQQSSVATPTATPTSSTPQTPPTSTATDTGTSLHC